MIVYRVEKNGKGPFFGGKLRVVPLILDKINFKKGEKWSDFKYAFASRQKAKDYFGEEQYQKLLNRGYELKKYKAHVSGVRWSDHRIEMAVKKDQLKEIEE